jgi:hypothetical protein
MQGLGSIPSTEKTKKKKVIKWRLVVVTHICNLSYLVDGDKRIKV